LVGGVVRCVTLSATAGYRLQAAQLEAECASANRGCLNSWLAIFVPAMMRFVGELHLTLDVQQAAPAEGWAAQVAMLQQKLASMAEQGCTASAIDVEVQQFIRDALLHQDQQAFQRVLEDARLRATIPSPPRVVALFWINPTMQGVVTARQI